jgi:uncharacterized damage-inducible protein DinB
MNPLLIDFYGHQVWADAEHWRAMEAHPPARNDEAIRKRLHHIHLVQHVYLWAVGDRQAPWALTRPEDFTSLQELKTYAREYHDEVARFLETVTDARLGERIGMPWFKDPPLTITVTEALAQCAMHSHYHRGQNAMRLRELGGEPPLTDLVFWYWKGRPAPDWGA